MQLLLSPTPTPERHKRRLRTIAVRRLTVEPLEPRCVLAVEAPSPLPLAEMEPNDTLDVAQDVGNVGGQGVEIQGSLRGRSGRSTDVDWCQFSLSDAAEVHLRSLPGSEGSTAPVVLTLYSGHDGEFDPEAPLGHRLLSQQVGSQLQAAEIAGRLGPGTYYVAVSGAGNRYFHPFLADSGVAGESGDYGLSITSNAPGDDGAIGELVNLDDGPAPEPWETGLGDDTPETANSLGALSTAGLLKVAGVVGNDPFYDLESSDPLAANPAADVDLYGFRISGPDRHALVVEAFAGRIGSPLDPALTLYRSGAGGVLELVATNDNSLNPTVAANDSVPLYTDAVLYAGLTEGDYFLAVSSSSNSPEWGPEGVFDPLQPHSGENGATTGKYVLNLRAYVDNEAPRVQAATLAEGAVLRQPPREFAVQFSEAVNLQQLAYAAFQQVSESTVSAVYILSAAGARYFPRLESFDPASHTARFLMLDGLPSGAYELHLSGAIGLNDFADNPLVGNDPSGDHVIRFTVEAPERGSPGDALQWVTQNGNDHFQQAQDLGVLFPHELQETVGVVRDVSQFADQADYFRFEVLQSQSYFFTLTKTGLSQFAGPGIELFDAQGHRIDAVPQGTGSAVQAALEAGAYVQHIGDWSAEQAADVAYRVAITLGGLAENPTPLTSGAAPAVDIRLFSSGRGLGSSPAPPSLPAPVFVGAPTFGASSMLLAGASRESWTNRVEREPLSAIHVSLERSYAAGSLLVEAPRGLNRGFGAAPLGSDAKAHSPWMDPSNDSLSVRLGEPEEDDRLLARLDSHLALLDELATDPDEWTTRNHPRDRGRHRLDIEDALLKALDDISRDVDHHVRGHTDESPEATPSSEHDGDDAESPQERSTNAA